MNTIGFMNIEALRSRKFSTAMGSSLYKEFYAQLSYPSVTLCVNLPHYVAILLYVSLETLHQW
jgi:hypothetical protein